MAKPLLMLTSLTLLQGPALFAPWVRRLGRNPLSVIVPCHRVMGANGALTGYAGGLQRKQHLLQLEAQHA